jgi:hypothetical protein
MISVPMSAVELLLPCSLAVLFLLWVLWNLLHESGTVTFRFRSLLRPSRRHTSRRTAKN